jgi:hypothetical protein
MAKKRIIIEKQKRNFSDEQMKNKFIKLLRKAEQQTGWTIAGYLKFDVNGILPRLTLARITPDNGENLHTKNFSA